jgi:ABC-2 type transport system ATP-binding protein
MARDGSAPAITIRNLTKRYGTQEAVSDLDVVIPAGQLIGLLGPNGAGKSTTIKMLMGMLPPTSGTASVGGFDVVKNPLEVKRIAGYVPESAAVFEALTGWEYLNLVAALHRIPESEAALRIERFGAFFDLSPLVLQAKRLGGYSKGMRQKVVVTAALLHNPRIVFLDEPLEGLDANAALMLKTLISSLAREGTTIVYCSHVLDVVERMVERVLIVHHGRVIADGTVSQILARVGVTSLEQAFNELTATRDLLQRAEDFARVLSQ